MHKSWTMKPKLKTRGPQDNTTALTNLKNLTAFTTALSSFSGLLVAWGSNGGALPPLPAPTRTLAPRLEGQGAVSWRAS